MVESEESEPEKERVWFPLPSDEEWEYRVTYFPYYVRGEWARTALVIADVEWVDNVVQGDDWPNWKEHAPNNYMPVLEANGSEKLRD